MQYASDQCDGAEDRVLLTAQDETQAGIVAESVLGLPREARA
jgi:hypothetical protein